MWFRTSSRLIFGLAALAATTVTAGAESVQKQPVQTVVELFTSQGCSSCPAADALFESYAKRPDLVALTFSVDYWDYMGWKDTLASPRFTARQRTYARLRGDGQIYTPQMVVHGGIHTNGADKSSIERALKEAQKTVTQRLVPISVGQDAGTITIKADAGPTSPQTADATLWLVTLNKRVDVMVKRGENAGKTLSYFNVVREMTSIGMWNGEAMTIKLQSGAVAHKGEDACAIILQSGKSGQILGAAMLPSL